MPPPTVPWRTAGASRRPWGGEQPSGFRRAPNSAAEPEGDYRTVAYRHDRATGVPPSNDQGQRWCIGPGHSRSPLGARETLVVEAEGMIANVQERVVKRSPFTQTSPPSGLTNPRRGRNMVVSPVPFAQGNRRPWPRGTHSFRRSPARCWLSARAGVRVSMAKGEAVTPVERRRFGS
jgi:hypothetical protein